VTLFADIAYRKSSQLRATTILSLFATALFFLSCAQAQTVSQDWQAQIRKYAATQDWKSAMRVVDQQIALEPHDMDVRAWRARVLAWSGQFPAAEKEYLSILEISRKDPDVWMGLATVYLAEGKTDDAERATEAAEELDPHRADLHAARARALRAAGDRNEARSEFQAALSLDPASTEARDGLISVRGEAKNELRVGEDNDLLNYSSAYHDEWVSLVSQWTARWATGVAANVYQRGGTDAGKFVGSITRRQPKWGAATIGGAVGHDNGVIPRSEAFFDLDHGWRTSETAFLRAVEFDYAQHWYWYQSARILTLNGTSTLYLPREWTFALGLTGARSAFTGTGAEWRPSELGRLGFPLAGHEEKRLTGNVFFAAGTEDFAQVDQIGRFASQTYGGGLKWRTSAHQDVTGYAAYQKRTQGKTDVSFGLSYGIHF
jgi:tetratricopeptide (TPR) repeat protein